MGTTSTPVMAADVVSISCSCCSCEERLRLDKRSKRGEQFSKKERAALELIKADKSVEAVVQLLSVSSRESLPLMALIPRVNMEHDKQALKKDSNNHRIMSNMCMLFMKLENWGLAHLYATTIIKRHAHCV